MNSINTNRSALLALQALNTARADLTLRERRAATGLAVTSAADNGALYVISQAMQVQTGAWKVVGQALDRGQSILDTATSATNLINTVLGDVQVALIAFANPALSDADKDALRRDVEAGLSAIDRLAANSHFDGVNLLTPGAPGVVERRPTTTYRFPLPPLTPQSFQTVMNAGSADVSVQQAFTSVDRYTLPYSPLTPDGFASALSQMQAVAAGTQVSRGQTLYAGGQTVRFVLGDSPRYVDFPLDLFSEADVVEVWQGDVRVAATGQASAASGAVPPGTSATGRQTLGFNYDPTAGSTVELRIAGGGANSKVALLNSADTVVSSRSEHVDLPATPLTLESSGAPAANGVNTVTVQAGALSGRVDLLFDAALTPDVVEVWQNGARVAASGQPYATGGAAVPPGAAISGVQVISFDYDPALGDVLEFRFNETNPHAGAAWVVGGLVLQDPATPQPSPTKRSTVTGEVRVTAWDDADFIGSAPPLTPETNAEASASRTYTIAGGDYPGRVNLTVEPYADADVIEIWQNGVRVAASGQPYARSGAAVGDGAPVAEPSTLSFDYDPARGSQLEFRFNPNSQTPGGWTVTSLTLDAPDAPDPTPPTQLGGASTGVVLGTVQRTTAFLKDPNGGSLDVQHRDLSASGLGLRPLDWGDPQAMLSAISAAVAQGIEAGTHFGALQAHLSGLQQQAAKQEAALTAGIGNLIDADLSKEAARLEAAQVRTQLALQTLSIANRAPEWITTLFQR